MRKGAIFVLGIALLSRRAIADTPLSIWQRAAHPHAAEEAQRHANVRSFIDAGRSSLPPFARDSVFEHVRVMLETSGAQVSTDVRLRFDLGEVYEALERHEEAISVLEPALQMAPEHPEAAHAFLTLAYAHAKRDEPMFERDAYVKYLARLYDDRAKSIALLNLAEAEMRLGRLKEAVSGYKDAFDLATSIPNSQSASETATLAAWGLAVAQDRSGDSFSAERTTELALRLDPGMKLIAHGENVFFVPEYERLYYLGLGAESAAKHAEAPARTEAWRDAELAWKAYVVRANPKDKWLSFAKVHAARATRERERLEAKRDRR